MQITARHWLAAPLAESVFILAPPLISVMVVILFQDYFTSHHVSTFWWVLLVLSIDVGHVYSTLFRLYWDKEIFRQNRKLLVVIPVVSFVAGAALYSFSDLVFWRVLAYLAVFHFVRQQYGFMRLYSRKENVSKAYKLIDALAVYSATLYPIAYWHLHPTGNISWFVPGDFLSWQNDLVSSVCLGIYIAIIVVYLIKEAIVVLSSGEINLPRNMILLGTYLSWYTGIVAFQADLLFTLLNVVSHGIPYMALIWIYGEKRNNAAFTFTAKGIAIFLSVLILLAYTEEFFWDIFVWNDHPEIFPAFTGPVESQPALMLLVPLLVLPQVTHYILDGFIWKIPKGNQHPA